MIEVSVIVPVYNASDYLRRCINSILEQTFKNFELILIDDGSMDDSGEICDEFAAIDHRIRVIHQRNLGVSAARNQGLNYAQGTYIMFCDADDWVREDWIINLVCGIKKFPGSWVICGIEYIENGIPMRIEPFGCKDDVIQKGIHDYYLIYEEKLDGYCFNKIYRMDIIQTNRIRFHSGITFGEDIAYNLSYLKYVDNIVGLPKCLYCYNADNLESATRKFDAYRFENHRYVYHLRKPFIAPYYRKAFSNGFYDICMWDIECIFDKKNVWKFRKKIKYSNYILRTSEFRECVKMGASDGMNRWYLAALHTGNYLLVKFLENIRMLLNKTARKKG